MTLAELVVALGVDTSDFQKGLDTAGAKMEALGKRLSAAGRTLSLAVTAPLVAAGAGMAKLAIDAEETASKFETVLGPAAAGVAAEIQRMRDTIPSTTAELKNAVADMTALGKAAGLTQDAAAELSLQFVTAAADLGSFNNVPTPEALMAIRSALVGSSEPMLRFGVDTRVAALEAIALEHGLIAAGQEMDATARAQAVLIAIQEDASDAMGDAARTAESTANQLKFLKSDVIELATQLGQQLIPMIRPLIEQLSEWMGRLSQMNPEMQKVVVVVGLVAAAVGPLLIVIGTLASAIGAIGIPVAVAVVAIGGLVAALVAAYTQSETFRDIVNAAWEGIREVAERVFPAIRETVQEVLAELEETLRPFLDWLAEAWAENGEEIMAAVRVAFEFIGEMVGEVVNIISNAIQLVLNLIQGDWSEAWENVKEIVGSAVDVVVGHANLLWKGVMGALNDLKREAVEKVQEMVDAIAGIMGQSADDARGSMERFKDAALGPLDELYNRVVGNSIIPDMVARVIAEFDTMKTRGGELADDLRARVVASFEDTALSAGKLTDAFKTQMDRLIEQRAELSLSTEAFRILQLRMEGLTEAEARRVVEFEKSIVQMKEAREEAEKQREEAERFIEKLNEEISALQGVTAEQREFETAMEGATEAQRGQIEMMVAQRDALQQSADAWDQILAGINEDVRENERQVEASTKSSTSVLDQLFQGNPPAWLESWAAFWAGVTGTAGAGAEGIHGLLNQLGGWLDDLFGGKLGDLWGKAKGWLEKITGSFGESFDGILGKAGKWFGSIGEAFDGGFSGVLTKLGGFLGGFDSSIVSGLGGIFSKVGGFIGGPWGIAITTALDVLGIDISQAVSKIGDIAVKGLTAVGEGIGAVGGAIVDGLGALGGGIADALGSIFGGPSEAEMIASGQWYPETVQMFEDQFGYTPTTLAELGKVDYGAAKDTTTYDSGYQAVYDPRTDPTNPAYNPGLTAALKAQPRIPTPLQSPTKSLRGLAAGGTLSAFEPAIVGERGPELFVPGIMGTILPSGVLERLTVRFAEGIAAMTAAAAARMEPVHVGGIPGPHVGEVRRSLVLEVDRQVLGRVVMDYAAEDGRRKLGIREH